MKTTNGQIILEDASGFMPVAGGVEYTDASNTRVFIPYSLLIRVYDGVKYHWERNGIDWEQFCDSLFTDEKRSSDE